jgi:hypothetical protein
MSTVAIPTLDAPPLPRYGAPSLEYGASPAAGAHFVQAIAGNYFARLISLHCKLVCSATVASREVVIEYRDAAGKRFGLSGINTTVTAGLTAYYEFSAFQPEAVATVDGSALVPLNPILLRPTDDFRVYVVAIDTTDQLSEIRFVWERFLTAGEPPGAGM